MPAIFSPEPEARETGLGGQESKKVGGGKLGLEARTGVKKIKGGDIPTEDVEALIPD